MKIITALILGMLLAACVPVERTALTEDHAVYLPFVVRQEPPPKLITRRWPGVHNYNTHAVQNPWLIPTGAPVKVQGRWDLVEAERGIYDWTALDRITRGLEVNWLVLQMTPDWARNPGDELCHLPAREYWDDFAAFANAAYQRYGAQSTTSIHAGDEYNFVIELWNEPDFDTAGTALNIYFGCVMDGELYGEFVSYVGSRITGAMVAAPAVGNVLVTDFTTDFLQAVDADSYDIFSYHCYASFMLVLNEEMCFRFRDQAQEYAGAHLLVLSETGVLYRVGQTVDYPFAQVRYFQLLQERQQTPWYWFTACCNGWPPEAPTDLVYRVDGEYVPQPVWYEYQRYYSERNYDENR